MPPRPHPPFSPARTARLGTALTAAVLVVGVSPAQAGPAHAPVAPDRVPGGAPAGIEQQVLFKSSQDPGSYACFRIPALVTTTNGTLLAFAEGRVKGCGDSGDVDLVLKRSTDGGRTWGPLQVVDEGAGDTHGNPAPVVDRRTGRVLLVETWNSGAGDDGHGGCSLPCDRTPHLRYSDDDGLSWSKPRRLGPGTVPPGPTAWYATGPVHGIQLRHGPHPGRLVIGVNSETWGAERVLANHAALLVSDDGGDHWRIGAHDVRPVAADGLFRQKPSELTVTERADGVILVSGREEGGTDLGHRTQAFSTDGGDTFTTPFRALPGLYAPQVQCSTLRAGHRLLLACPADPDRRRTMTIRSSFDGGHTWDGVDRGTVVTRDWSGYSDMTMTADGMVGLVYEGGAADARDEIRFARFAPEEVLEPRRGSGGGPVTPEPTPDLTPGAAPAAVLGGARAASGALAFDGADDAVRVPFRKNLPLGTADFTVSLWFRREGDTRGEQPLLSMGGVGPHQPQVALRVVDDGVLEGLIRARQGATPLESAKVRAAVRVNEGAWHHAVLRRAGGRLTLTLDGDTASVPGVPGSVSRNSPFGVHVGERMDGRAHFKGEIAKVRVLRRGAVVLRLPLDQVTP